MKSFSLILAFTTCLLMAQAAPTMPMMGQMGQMGMGQMGMGQMGPMGILNPLWYLTGMGFPMGGGGYMGYKDKDEEKDGAATGQANRLEDSDKPRLPTPGDVVAPMAEIADKIIKGEIADIPEKIVPKPILEAGERLRPGFGQTTPLPVQPRNFVAVP